MSISSAAVHSKIFWLAKGSTAKGSPTVTATGMPPLKTTRPALRTEKDTGSGGDTASTDSMGAGPLSAHDVGERACGGPESIGTALGGTGAQCTVLHCTGRAEGGWGRARDTTKDKPAFAQCKRCSILSLAFTEQLSDCHSAD